MESAGKTLSQLAAEFQTDPEQTMPGPGTLGFTANEPNPLGAVAPLDHLIRAMGATLADLIGGKPVLDLGRGDGGLAPFLESLGCCVMAIAEPQTFLGGMRTPGSEYGLAVLLEDQGERAMPLEALEQLAPIADYCYLAVSAGELAEGIAAKLWHAGWEMCARSAESQGRVFCILRRKDLFTNGTLLEGWFPAEGARDGWRWASDLFKIRFVTPAAGSVRFVYYVSAERLAATGPFTVGALRDGQVLARQEADRQGIFHIDIPVPIPANGPRHRPITTALTFWVSPGATAPGDERVLGVIVRQVVFVASA